MSMFSGISSRQINWDKADVEQKLAELVKLPPNDPLLGQLALQEADPRVRHEAIRHLESAAQWRLLGAVRADDEDCLAACLGERLGEGAESVIDPGQILAQMAAAPPSFRIAMVAHAKNGPLAVALTRTLQQDSERAQVARGKGSIDARAAAVGDMRDLALLEAIAHEYRDKQRRIYRAAHDRTGQLLAAREVVRHALELCDRLSGLLARHELTLTAFTNAEREWLALAASPSSPLPAQDIDDFPALQARYAALQNEARALLLQQAETWRDAERLKVAIAELAARSEADESVEPEAFAALVAEREAAEQRLAQAAQVGLTALPKERAHLAQALDKLVERHAILATENKALVNARRLAEELRADPAALTPAWRSDFARSIAIVRPALRAPIEEAAAAARTTIEAAARQQNEAQRAVELQRRAEIEALVKQMEQLLDKGQHQLANEIAATLKDKLARDQHAEAAARPLPAALEFRLKRCHDRLAKMNEWKRFGDIKAREALCREAEALVKRVTRQEKSQVAKERPADFPWPVGPQAVLQAVLLDTSPESAEPIEAIEPPSVHSPAESAETPTAMEAAVDVGPTAAEAPTPAAEVMAESTAPSDSPVQEAPATEVTNGDTSGTTSGATAPTQVDEPPLAPDALAAAVRDLQARWQQLDKAQGVSSKGLWERFRRACDRAYAPARKHFEELEKQRSENVEKKNAVLEKLAALGERIVDGAEWGKVLNERGELVKAWFDAGALPRRNAAAMQKKFDALTSAIDAKLGARRAAERARRRALIEQAKVIAERPADGASMAAMIALQKQWQEGMKGAIRLKAREDQTLWEAFRAAGSALFGKRDAEKAARATERDAQVSARRTLIDELQALASGDDAAALRRGIDELSARWQAMPWPERKPLREWEQKFSNARAAAAGRIAAIRGEAESRQRATAAARLAVVERAEQALGDGSTPDIDTVRTELQAMLAEDEKLDARVVARLATLDAAIKIGPDAWRAQAQKTQGERDALLLELEIVLGLPSPPELETARRMRMLKRLAESKNSRSTPPLMAPDAAKAVEKLLALPLAMQGVQARVEAVIEAARRAPK